MILVKRKFVDGKSTEPDVITPEAYKYCDFENGISNPMVFVN